MGKLLFRIARLKIMGTFVGFISAYFPFLVPAKKIIQNKKAVSFKHPSASYPNHILIIPRKIARNIFCLSNEDFLVIIEMAVKIRENDNRDFVLLINGGKRQEVMQAHFHLFTGNLVSKKELSKEAGKNFSVSDKLFWNQIVSDLHDLLKQNGVSETSFSMFIQFENNVDPSVYFIKKKGGIMMLKAGTASEIITRKHGGFFAGYDSKLPSDSVHDDLTVTAVALESNQTKVILMSVTLCLINNNLSRELRIRCGQAAGIPPSNIIISTVHTHSGPITPGVGDDYCDNILIPKCVAAAEASVKDMKPVKMGIATSKSLVGISRRQLLADDNVILGQNPWGAYDPEMTVISFRDESGKPITNLIHCAAHNTAAGVVTEVSRDWCGVMIDRLETESGAVTAFFNGCAGDIAPRMANGGSTGDMKHMREIGAVAGIDAVRTYKDIREYNNIDMAAVTDEIRIPFEPIKPLDSAKQQYAAIEHSTARFDGGARNLLKRVIEMHEKGENGPLDFVFEQTLVRIGPAILVPFPFEPFAELSMRLRTYSKFGYTLALGYTNGSNSYLPSQDQICRGGYEIERFQWSMPRQLPVNTDTLLINANLKIMEKLL
jgi:diadenosine tetraphosphate (Ap4A) HIT family hydrolase